MERRSCHNTDVSAAPHLRLNAQMRRRFNRKSSGVFVSGTSASQITKKQELMETNKDSCNGGNITRSLVKHHSERIV